MPQTDAAVVALARDGDSEAFRALVERHSRAVYRLAHRMTGTPQDAEDVVQETFLKVYKQLSRFESRANFSTWLHRIAVNCSIDLIRSRPHREAGHDAADLDQLGAEDHGGAGHASPERLMLSTEVQDRVTSAMWSLSQMERAAFVLRHFEGQSIEEISRALGLKANAAKHSIFRAVANRSAVVIGRDQARGGGADGRAVPGPRSQGRTRSSVFGRLCPRRRRKAGALARECPPGRQHRPARVVHDGGGRRERADHRRRRVRDRPACRPGG